MHRWTVLLLMAGFSVGCGSTVNVEHERETLMRLDREWAASVKDMDKFMSYYAPDASDLPVRDAASQRLGRDPRGSYQDVVGAGVLSGIWSDQSRRRCLG